MTIAAVERSRRRLSADVHACCLAMPDAYALLIRYATKIAIAIRRYFDAAISPLLAMPACCCRRLILENE